METLWQDLRYGARALAKKRGFTVVAILSLAIGIGANSAIFSVTNALLLRPLPYKDADRLVILWNRSPGLNVVQDWFSPGQYLDIKAENHVFEQVAATLGGSYNFTGRGTLEHVEGARVSSSLFPLFGAQPLLGRAFLPEEDEKGKPLTVILSHGFWQRRFGSDTEVIGQSLVLNDKSFTIVGVMAADFGLSKEMMPTVNGIQKAEVLLPLPLSDSDRTDRGHEDYNIFARLKSGVTAAEAQAEMDLLAEQMKQQYPAAYPKDGRLTLSVVPLLSQVVGSLRLALFVLFGAVGFVLLIACANVANLLLARAATRQKEIAIRAAVGAGRLRLLRQLLTESVLLALAGGLSGLLMALVTVKALRVFGAASIPRLNEVGIDGRVLGFTFLVSLLTGVVFGLIPALRASRVDLNEVLKDGGRRSTGGALGRGPWHIRNLLVVAEVALSLVLLIGAGLLIRSYQRIANASPGYDTHNVLSLRLALPATRYPNADAVIAFYQRLSERVQALPGVETVATSYLLPLSSNALGWGPLLIYGYVPKDAQELIISNEGFISPDYFQTLGIPLTRGRTFDERDKKGAPDVAIVDEHLAERFWPGEDPIGKRVKRGSGSWRTVVGVVRYEKEFSAEDEPLIRVYYPVNQIPVGTRYVIARVSTDPVKLTATVSEEIHALDPELPVFEVSTMDQRLYEALARRRFSMLLLGVFAALALLLAITGVYGVMSYWVTQRTHEIGIRMALGAEQRNILRLVIRQASLLVAAGIATGLTAAFGLTRLMASLLFAVSATDRLTFVLVSALLGGVALLASYLPARRASKVEPIIALRYE
ncbi:MAG: ABC transporter permease [Blastocatellia bacterium]